MSVVIHINDALRAISTNQIAKALAAVAINKIDKVPGVVTIGGIIQAH